MSKKRKVVLKVILGLIILCTALALINTYKWIVSGEQKVVISMAKNLYTNSDVYLNVMAYKTNGTELEAKTEVKLLDSKNKKVKGVETSKEGNTFLIRIPDVEAGNYTLEFHVSSKEGKDVIQKDIYLSKGHSENVTISFDKGIYKPGDTVNFRALLTQKESDIPLAKDVNVSIYDGNDNRVYNENVKTSDYGIMSGSFHLASEVNSGFYKLKVSTNASETIKEFIVNPYVVPKYEVTITTDKEKYLVGEMPKITFAANYFFGEVAPDTKLNVYINGEKRRETVTGSDGKSEYSFQVTNPGTYQIHVEAVDASNYYAEADKRFSVGTDLFEIELLPEFGTLAMGTRNDIYVFTKNADGSGLKTYLTVTSGNYTRQVATDNNGIGKFSIDIDNANASQKTFRILAEDMDGNHVNKNITLNVVKRTLLLSTDKPKYTQGDEINLRTLSLVDNTREIYFFKNDKLIKVLSTDSDETSVNLGDTYGLIDIYVHSQNSNSSSYYDYDYYNYSYRKNSSINSDNSYHRTIFIKPEKELQISIDTNQQEYKPGENIHIAFDATNENGTNVEAALLVSMLDNAVLNLAGNDLTIDNIKLALQDISFDDELDAATLYSCIVDDISEEAMVGLLLKQGVRSMQLDKNTYTGYDNEERAKGFSVFFYCMFAILALIYSLVRFKAVRNLFRQITTYLVFVIVTYVILYSLLDYYTRFYEEEWLLLITMIVGAIVYIVGLSKLYPYTKRTTTSIMIMFLLWFACYWMIEELYLEGMLILTLLAALVLVVVIVAKIVNSRRKKKGIVADFGKKELIYIGWMLIACIPSLAIGFIMDKLFFIGHSYSYINYMSRYPYDRYWRVESHTSITLPIAIIALYVINYFLNVRRMNQTEEQNEEVAGEETEESIASVVIGVIIGMTLMGLFLGLLFSFSQDTITGGGQAISDFNYSDSIGIQSDRSGASKAFGSSSRGGFSNFLDFSTSKKENTAPAPVVERDVVVETAPNDTQEASEEQVRNIFLESMCFIPELIASNGKASLDLRLADNITTWTIQTVGNTKDGRIGFGTKDDVKVFKEFFVDFELPKNLVTSDKVSIPVTVYNYTDEMQNVTLTVKEDSFFTLNGSHNLTLAVEPQGLKMTYVPLTINTSGTFKLRVEAKGNTYTDIVEKELTIMPKGYKVEKVVSNGSLDRDISEDILLLDNMIENTAKVKVKIYASLMAQAIEGMENIFRMPTGCFEQVSSSLYPNILALKYMEDNKTADEAIKKKALEYISSGYQKILAYEVRGERGGYSLYGDSPAETVLTAYGLMELTDLSKVYPVDEKVLEKMNTYLYGKQEVGGSFEITGGHMGGLSSREKLAQHAYIIWALSESNPKDSRLTKSVEYLKEKLEDVNDNYTLALIANVFANVGDKEAGNVVKTLINNIQINENSAYITSNIQDYYGTRYNYQTIQTVALTSMALSKTSSNQSTNQLLVNYLISTKDPYGTWHSTQATILALKALNEFNEKNKLDNQTVLVKLNSDERKVEIKDNALDLYEFMFENVAKENKLSIDIERSSAYYEVVEEYYIPYEDVKMSSGNNIKITVTCPNHLRVNERLDAKVRVENNSGSAIANGMVTISIPQGFVVEEDSLMKLLNQGTIEKYEMNYNDVGIYLRDFDSYADLNVSFRASYPVEITGFAVRAYDYYNPTIEGYSAPMEIRVVE